jgi:hypothetical protein
MKLRLLAGAALIFFLLTAFRSGWRHEESDFPNYYTAAVLVRKGLPLRDYYDWTWFQRQMNYAGLERTLGGYIPQTPVTMMPLVPLAEFEPQSAKRVWLVLNLFFLGGTVWMLARLTRFRPETIWLLTFAGFGSLYSNFLLGQYYVFLLFLLTLSFYCLNRDRHATSGFFSGVAFALKLYGGPFLLYFAVKRQWRAVAGMLVASAGLLAIAIALFGWADVHYFATQVLPRAMDGEVISPYHSGNNAMPVLLRRLLMAEPELNPHPLWNAPWLFFFLRPLFAFGILAFTLTSLASARAHSLRRGFAWFLIAMLLISPNISSYTTILLLLPLVLLLDDASFLEQAFFFVCYILLTLPTFTPWMWMFPKVWLLLAWFAAVGRDYLRSIALRVTPKLAAGIAVIVLIVAAADARRHLASYAQEPGRHYEQVAAAAGPVFSPVVTPAGVFYQTIGRDRYVLRRFRDNQVQDFAFEGEAFRPFVPSPPQADTSSTNDTIYFELVANRASTTMAFNVAAGKAEPASRSLTAASFPSAEDEKMNSSVVSPDGKWIAFTPRDAGPNRVWLRKLPNGPMQQLTGGNCNSQSPAWDFDSRTIYFTSDCGRGMGLPALYRGAIP